MVHMMQNKIEITMGFPQDFVEGILTKDVSTLDAIYDLIDNSIDAARDSIFSKGKFEKDQFGLPSSYVTYEINLLISSDKISIDDNCFGMEESTIKNDAFIIFNPSQHKYGIGQYGIGLKRSLLKMGSSYEFHIDNGTSAYEANFTNKHIGGSQGKLLADVKVSSGRPRTIFTVTNLNDEIQRDIQNARWLENAENGIKDRYSIYFTKGLVINLEYFNNPSVKLSSRLPLLRTDGKFLPTHKTLQIDDVKVIIESGIHELYHFPKEDKHSLSTNRKLTDEFGIYFICNDRVIVKASTEKRHGWKAKWHSEYNGFVCSVKFIAENSSSLPWNTAKSAMREDATLFLTVIDQLQPVADSYRSEIKKRYLDDESKDATDSESESHSQSENKKRDTKSKTTKKASGGKSQKRPSEPLHRDRSILIDWSKTKTHVDERFKSAYEIFYEMGNLSSEETPISCVLLLRAFLEETVKTTFKLMELNEDKKDNLASRTKKVAEKLQELGAIEHGLRHLVSQYSSTEGGLFSFSNIQSQIHSARFHPEKTKVNNYWDELDPFIAACWKYNLDNE